MTADIIMIIVGLLLIFASYFISEKIGEKSRKENDENVTGEETKELKLQEADSIKEQIAEILEDKKVNKIIETEEELSHISNEKIMAFDEFSKQVIEKIEANHKEVVFLYDMLNGKEEEIKKIIQETDQSKVAIEELLLKMHQEEEQMQEKMVELEHNAKKYMEIKESIPVLVEKAVEVPKEKIEEDIIIENIENNLDKQEFVSDVKEVDEMIEAMSEEEKDMLLGEVDAEQENNSREKILDMYAQGKSIVDISRELGKGQGEVKLVIDLFQGGKSVKKSSNTDDAHLGALPKNF